MKTIELTPKLEFILMDVPKITGTMDPKQNLDYHGEQCTGEEWVYLLGFWGWLHKNKLSYGHGNLGLRWEQWHDSMNGRAHD